ncbi:LOW QUALITY PROTEIN: uncharacterized protein MYH16 [Chlamydotis macqueenii]
MSDGYKEKHVDDADPMQFLAPPEKGKTEAMNKPYDIKKSCWVKEKGGFLAEEVQSEKDDKVMLKMVINQLSSTLQVQQESSSLPPPEEVQPPLSPVLFSSVGQPIYGTPFLRQGAVAARTRLEVEACPRECLPMWFTETRMPSRRMEWCMMNPSKFNQIDDMAKMTFLHEDRVLDNPCQHYAQRIYDLKGQRGMEKQHGGGYPDSYLPQIRKAGSLRRAHGSNSAFCGSWLIENVFTGMLWMESLEDQIIQVNPVLQTLDNIKTMRKNNSSHFGKFIRIHFGSTGRLAGANTESCLEKSHVISQEAAKRYYHIFHQMVSKKKLERTGLPLRSCFLCPILIVTKMHQGVIAADNTDDGEEPLLTNVAFDVLGSSPEEICVYKLTRAIVHLGTMKSKQKPRAEPEVDNTESGELQKGIIRRRVKAGNKPEQKGSLSTTVPERGIWPAGTCSPRPPMATAGCHYNNHLGKSPSFLKPAGGKGKGAEAHFEHRATLHWHSKRRPVLTGILKDFSLSLHSITGWLQKNDPLKEAVMGLLQKSSVSLFKAEEAAGRVNIMRYNKYCQLNVLSVAFCCPDKCQASINQKNLLPTVIVISPAQDSAVERINHKNCELQRGRATYQSLNPSKIPPGSADNKKASELSLGSTDLGEKECRTGYNKGILATLEDMRDEPLAKILTMPQRRAHGFLMRTEYKKMLRRLGLMAIQRNVQKFLQLLFWGGWKLSYGLSQGDSDQLQQQEQENLLDAEERLAQMRKSKMDLLSPDPGYKGADMSASMDVGGLLSDLKCDLEGLETEKEKQALDHRVQTLTSDLSAQNDSVTKCQKEKRALQEVHQFVARAGKQQSEENKVNHLTKNNSKPTPQTHELEDKWEQENKIHLKVEKAHHKAESDLKMTIANLNETEAKLGRGCKAAHILKSWKKTWKLSMLWRNKEECVEEAGVATTAQNCKQEAGPLKLLLELEEAALEIQATGSNLRRKHTVAVAEVAELMENPHVKAKLEMDKQVMKTEMDDLSASMGSLQKSEARGQQRIPPQTTKAATGVAISARQNSALCSGSNWYQKAALNSDARVHKLEDNEANAQLAGVEKSQAEINVIRLQEHKEAESRLNQIVHMKILTSQADDFKRQLDEESKSRTAAAVSLANTKHDLEPAKRVLEEEEESKAELQCLVSKLNTEVTVWRTKYKTDGTERTKELEKKKNQANTQLSRSLAKLAVRLQEAEETAELAQAVANMEKTRQRLQKVKDLTLTLDLEKANAAYAALDKKQRAFDKILAEQQQKMHIYQVDVDSSQTEYTTENSELKTAYEESLEHLESMKKENKAVQEEIKDLINQLGREGRAFLSCKRQRLEIEKDELQVAREAESSLEAEESKQICIQLTLAQVNADVDRRTTRYSEDITLSHRSNHQQAIESLQASLETEAKGSAEALRLEKMDTDLTCTEMQLDHANRNNSELVRTLNKLPQHVKRDLLHLSVSSPSITYLNLSSAFRSFGSKRMRMLASTRRCRSSTRCFSPLQTELEEAQTSLEDSENSRLLEIRLVTIKKLEPDLQRTTNEHEEIVSEYAADERAKKAVADIKELETELDSKQKPHVETKILHKNQRPLKEPAFHKQWPQNQSEQEANQSLAKRKTIHELDNAEERKGMAESALNKLHTRHCVLRSQLLHSSQSFNSEADDAHKTSQAMVSEALQEPKHEIPNSKQLLKGIKSQAK